MVVDPFHDLIQGVLQGHALAQQLRNEAQQQEMYQRSLVRDQQDSQMRDMQAQQMLTQYGRPVTGNMVQDTTSIPDPDTPGQVKTVPFPRPVDKSRLMSYTKSDGTTLQSERYTPEEFSTRAAQMQEGAKNFEAWGANTRAQAIDNYNRQTLGSDPSPLAVAFGLWPAGRKVLPGQEQENLQKSLRDEWASYNKPVAEGTSEVQIKPYPPAVQALMAGHPDLAPGPQPAAAPPNAATPFGSGAPSVNAPAGGSATPAAPSGGPTAFGSGAQMVLPPGASPTSLADLQANWRTKQQGFINTVKAAAANAGAPPAATAPGAQAYPRVVFQGGVKGTTAEDLYLDSVARKLPPNADGTPKTRKDLSQEQIQTAISNFAKYKANPEALAESNARLAEARTAREQAQQYRETTHQDTLNNQAAQRGQQSYEFQQRDTAKTTRAVEDAADSYQKLKDALNQNTIQADAVIAPMLLKLTAGGAGSGVRMTEAELGRVFGGRGKWQELQAKLSRYNPDSNKAIGIPDVQRQQIRNLVQTIGQRIDQKTAALQDFQQGISDPNNNDPVEHRRLRLVLENNIRAIDSGKPLPAAGAPGAAPGTAPAAAAKAPAGPAPNPAAAIAALPRAKTRGQQATETIVEQYGRAYGNDKAKTGAALTAAGYTGF